MRVSLPPRAVYVLSSPIIILESTLEILGHILIAGVRDNDSNHATNELA